MNRAAQFVTVIISLYMSMALSAEPDLGAPIVHTAAVMDAEELLPDARATYTRKDDSYFEFSMTVGRATRDLGIGTAAVHGKFALCSLYDVAQSQGKTGAVVWRNPDIPMDMVAFVSSKDEVEGIAKKLGMNSDQLSYVAVVAEARSSASAGYPCKQFSDPPRRNVTSSSVKERHSTGAMFKDCDACPWMVSIPAGTFDMGTGFEDARPVHKVTIQTFAMGKTEVTRGEFGAFVSDSRYQSEDKCAVLLIGGSGAERPGHNWRDVGFIQEDNHPVTCVSWQDAQAYVDWLSRKTGRNYRLPSEAEWEYAARAGTATPRYWDSTGQDACSYANVPDSTFLSVAPAKSAYLPSSATCSDGFAYTAPVGSFKSNAFGLFDMLGNVWEWVEDRYHDDYVGAPTDGSAWTTSKFDFRMFRGGSWSDAVDTNVATRSRKIGGPRANIVGFRVAVTE
jgi:sulfatase modifying factor 1